MKKTLLFAFCMMLSLCTFAATNTTNDAPKKVKMILDVDTGIDDAMAIAYAIASPEIELIGVTTTFGNVALATSNRNTLALLDMLNQKGIPVYPGFVNATGAKGVYKPGANVEFIHGMNGLGNVKIASSSRKVESKHAADFMIESANKYGKDLYIVAVGPQTNLAAALKKDPSIADKIGKIVIMGGALLVEGNINHYAEANINNDPYAADEIFKSKAKITMVGLDVTQRTVLTKEDTKRWRDLGTVSGKAYANIVDYYIGSYAKNQPQLGGCSLHDPLAVVVAIHPEYVKTLNIFLKAGTDKADFGRTIGLCGKMNDPNPNVSVCVDVKVKDFVSHFTNTLTELFRKN